MLLLDEPTNDLDVDTLRALEAGLESFPGCVVVISHDRWFLDRIATHILAFEGDSQVRWFEGNVSDYEAFRHKELGTAADQPHRIRYKRLARLTASGTSTARPGCSGAPGEPGHVPFDGVVVAHVPVIGDPGRCARDVRSEPVAMRGRDERVRRRP